MKKIIFSILSALILTGISSFSGSDMRLKHFVKQDKYKAEYETLNGLLDGSYVSWYPNGQKKAEGKFSNNMRSGTWTVWDSTGRTVAQREYRNTYDVDFILPASKVSPLKQQLAYNDSGFYSYFPLEQKNIAVSKRTWHFLPADPASPLFANDDFYTAIYTLVTYNQVRRYEDDQGQVPINDAVFPVISTGENVLLGYRIKEDWFYDKIRSISERRPVTICPVIRTASGDTLEAGWMAFSNLRSRLSKIKVKGTPSFIRTLDDVFFFHFYHGDYYKETNVRDQKITDYASGEYLTRERERIETDMIELEHAFWGKL
jgi:hypothetical protein